MPTSAAWLSACQVQKQASWVALDEKGAFAFVQGVAWIDPATSRILRLRTELQRPELSVGMRWETTKAECAEVTFKEGGKTLWLPREVIVSGQLKEYSFHNQHRYSDYRFFLVQTEEKEKGPQKPSVSLCATGRVLASQFELVAASSPRQMAA
jgi:hypothetical protein